MYNASPIIAIPYSAVAWAGGTVFYSGYAAAGPTGSLWYVYSPDGMNWGQDTLVQNVGLSYGPSALVYNGALYVFHQGYNGNGQLWYSVFDGADWASDTLVTTVGMAAHPPQ